MLTGELTARLYSCRRSHADKSSHGLRGFRRATKVPGENARAAGKPLWLYEVELIKSVFIALAITCLITSAADAQHRHHRTAQKMIVCNERGCSDRAPAHQRGDAGAAHADASVVDANGNTAVIGGRPAGCPAEFCGCEASLYVFGEIRRELNLASAWMRKFPHAQPAAGMAAVRNHHVMILMRQVNGKDWLVHDGNSGGRKTREHLRSIAGYVIVDPHASRSASVE
jgi:hypothetical protein